MPYDIEWEAACNDFHPAFALVRGERFVPDAKPIQRRPAPPANRGIAPGKRNVRLEQCILTVPEFSR